MTDDVTQKRRYDSMTYIFFSLMQQGLDNGGLLLEHLLWLVKEDALIDDGKVAR